MSTRDDARLTAQERAALANLEAAATADDPQLASRLRGSAVARLDEIVFRLRSSAASAARTLQARAWLGLPLAIVGLVLVVAGMQAGLALGLAGALVTTGGLLLVAQKVRARYSAIDRGSR
jgi:Protein of unknown function (DUF3040)